eukprot:CFRG0507T1
MTTRPVKRSGDGRKRTHADSDAASISKSGTAKKVKVTSARAKKAMRAPKETNASVGVEGVDVSTTDTAVTAVAVAKPVSNWQILSQKIHKNKKSGGGKADHNAFVRSVSVKSTVSPTTSATAPQIGVVAELSTAEKKTNDYLKRKRLVTGTYMSVTKHVAIDCEMVGVGFNGKRSALAQVAIVNAHGQTILNEYVAIKEKVTDYRTHVSGITKEKLEGAKDFETVQKMVHDMCGDKIIVGHSLQNDLKVLMLSHSKSMIRDTAKYKPLRSFAKGRTPSLKLLAEKVLEIQIQTGEHSPAEDAAATMQIFNKHKSQWEEDLRKKRAFLHRKKKKTNNREDD